ncbi:MAG TPA: hypothetical protein VMF06_22800, partial [Candidatus Limnocylindria bacterium]|nr:hypothetical protein [Candidatus Limnocylindria bacterium]
MKQRLLALAWAVSLLFVAPHVGYAQLSEGSGATQGLSGAWLTNALTGTVEGTRDDLPEKGLHHKHVRWVQRVTNEVGETLDVTNSYVHMQPGLHYLTTNGQLAESRPVFEIKDGVAIANRMQFKVRIGGNIASAGYLEVAMPDGRKLRSHLDALRYFDPVSGQAAIISTVKPTQAYIVGDNQVVFPNAFSNVTADVRYTISVAGIEQDVLVHPEAPLPAPEDFGLPSATARLEVISEFLNPPATLRRSSTNDPSATRVTRGGVLSRLRAEDIDIDFGSMQIGEGSAFKVGSGTNGPPITVGKRWLRLNSAGQVAAESETAARQFLIEAVDVVAVEPVLPGESTTPGGAMLKRSGNRNVLVQSDFQAIPPLRESSNEEASVRRDPPASLLAALAGPLLVLDYVEQLNTGTHNNFTFLSGLTYFISGNHDFTGTTVLEGGAVIKMELWPQNTTPQHQMVIHGPVVCKTSASLPLIITARDDDTVGAVHASSTGTVTYGYGTYGLYFAWDSPAVELKYIHFA